MSVLLGRRQGALRPPQVLPLLPAREPSAVAPQDSLPVSSALSSSSEDSEAAKPSSSLAYFSRSANSNLRAIA